ncbi:hypothetical protein [Polaromonas sp. LjRoot131]|uniref:hypothetical protein n=1 Tax=Polaromonas sp. LjRoot131 TaxID=3342262 RepID=UPI003ECE460B
MFNAFLALLRRALRPTAQTRAILRDERSEGNLRYLGATYSSDGNLVIEGQDLGDAVEAAFGYREYEWTWTIARTDLPKLAAALDTSADLMAALESRFEGPAAAGLAAFLQEHRIPYESWSRIGD